SNRLWSSRDSVFRGAIRQAKFVFPAGAPEQANQAPHLRCLFFTGREPREITFQSKTVDDDGFLIAVFANAFRAVSATEATVFDATHGRVGNNIVHQAVVDADCPGKKLFGHLACFLLVPREYASI